MTWTEPFTWVDGTNYSESTLEQQFVGNIAEVPHLLGFLPADVDQTNPPAAGEAYKPVFAEMTVPLGVNETWHFLEIIRHSGSGVQGTDQVRFGWYTPLGAFMQGTGPTIDGSGNPYLHNIVLNNTGAAELEWESGVSFPAHQSGAQRLTWIEFFATTGSTAGSLSCGFASTTSLEATVYAGTCLLGMKVSP